MREVWKSLPGFVGRYEVSNLGRVRSLISKEGLRQRPMILKSKDRINLRKNGKTVPVRISHLIALSFIGPRPRGHVVRHLDDVRSNNWKRNIRYGTPLDNSRDAKRNGRPVGRPKREKVQ